MAKKLLNSPADYVDESLDGLCAAFPDYVRTGEGGRVIARRNGPSQGKVGIVSGGGFGHLPLFAGYVGKGLLTSCSVGQVFAGPTAAACADAIRVAHADAGVLCLYGNYGGDKMNFNLACRETAKQGIRTETVLGTDDVASAPPAESDKRRGVAGIVFAYKAAGAKAEAGASLEEVAATARKAVDRCRTMGVAVSPCEVPGAGKPTFTLGAGEIEIGMGIHGEPGIERRTMASAEEVCTSMLLPILAEAPAGAHKVALLWNSLGATPIEELFILHRTAARMLREKKIEVARTLVGHYATSMEMAGCSLSLLFLDDELRLLLDAPTECRFWT